MLIAAMVLGLLVGVGEFLGGLGYLAAIAADSGVIHWWAVALVPIGLVATLGGVLALSRPGMAAILLLSSCVANAVVGLVSIGLDEIGGSFLLWPAVFLALAGALALGKQLRRPPSA
ncbi:MAG: hypothetical protein FJ012_01355 [Chloroflexi bacterium]|nr:hypothetical protein [Chloroflexota bacterium]